MSQPLRILFVITGLGVGGAEMMLIRLLQNIDVARVTPAVLTLTEAGPLGKEITALGVPLFSLGMGGGKWRLKALPRLVSLVRNFQPDILQGWMYHGNLAAQAAALFSRRRPPVIWNIRGTVIDLAGEPWSTAATIWLGARLSRFASVVINNSQVSARMHHERLGYSLQNVVVVANGFDTARYRPDPLARAQFRGAVEASDDDFLIGHVGRLHPMKDHENLVRAAAICIAVEPRARFVLIGADVDGRSRIIRDMADEAGIGARLKYLGPRQDVEQIMPSFDLFTLTSSYGEGFPNAVGEAMACGVPCVVTDVGDSGHVVGTTGEVVPPGDPGKLAEAWLRLLRLPPQRRAYLGECARQRIMEDFSLAAIVQRYEELYDRVARQYRRA